MIVVSSGEPVYVPSRCSTRTSALLGAVNGRGDPDSAATVPLWL